MGELRNPETLDNIRAFRIRAAREAAGLTTQELADKININRNTLYGYERGLSDPKSEGLLAIADACGCTVDYLLGRTLTPTEAPELSPVILEELPETIGQRIATMRKRASLTQGELADKIGVSGMRISQFENEIAIPKKDRLVAIANACGCTVEDLTGEAKTDPAPTEMDAEPVEVKASEVYDLLVKYGFVKDGQDLSRADARFIRSVLAQMREWFSDKL